MDAVGEPRYHIFFDFRAIVYREWVPPGQTVDQFFYSDVVDGLC